MLSPRLGRCLVMGCLGVALAGCHRGWRAGSETPPNVVLIVVDTLRADHLGTYGYERKTSPHIDRLAREGAVYERAYSHCPWTLPSIASILTSLHPRDHGISTWGQPLSDRLDTLAEVFQANGYQTTGFVSHYILKPGNGFEQGFMTYDSAVVGKRSPHDVATSRAVTHNARHALRKLPEPFFLFVHYFDPHAMYMDHPQFPFGDADMDRYDSEIAYTDDAIGNLVGTLDELGLDGRTIVVVTADHGEEFKDHGGTMHTLTLFEELIHIPLIMRVPGFKPTRIPAVVVETDIAPTLLSLAGIQAPAAFQGRVLDWTSEGFQVPADREVVAETLEKVNKQGIVIGKDKLIRNLERNRLQLFDLATDPGEQKNLQHEDRRTTEILESRLDEFYAVPRATIDTRVLDTETQDALKALGYLDASPGSTR